MVLANCHAGNGSANIVPEHAAASLDIRYTGNDDPHKLLATIQKLSSSEVTLKAMEPVFESGPSPFLELLVKYSDGAAVGFEHGASDARYLSRRNVPGAIWGADGELSQHTDNEHIVISTLFSIYESLDKFLTAVQASSEEQLEAAV